MKLLVIGRAGQLAQSLFHVGGARGYDITSLARPDIDLARAETIRSALDTTSADAVINAAAYTAVDKAEDEPELADRINRIAPGVIAAHCAERDRPLIHVSTDYVFDGAKTTPYWETDPVAPVGVYGRVKLAGEQRVSEACADHVILRTAWLHSPYGSNFIKTMLRLAENRNAVGVVDDQWGTPTYAPHLADAILIIAQKLFEATRNKRTKLAGLYHAAGSGETTWCRLARTAFAASSARGGPTAVVNAIATADYPTKARRPPNSRLNCTKLEGSFGVSMPDWQLGVQACVKAVLKTQVSI